MKIIRTVTIAFLINNIFCNVLLASETKKPIITDMVMIVHNIIYTDRATGLDYVKIMDASCRCDGKKVDIKPVNDEMAPIFCPMSLFSEDNGTLKDNIKIKFGGNTHNVHVKVVKAFIPPDVKLNKFDMIKISGYKKKWWSLGIPYPTNSGDTIPGVELDVLLREPYVKLWSQSLPYDIQDSTGKHHVNTMDYTFPRYVPQSLFFDEDGTLKEEQPLIFFNVGNDYCAAKLIVNLYESEIFRKKEDKLSLSRMIVMGGVSLVVMWLLYMKWRS